MDEVLSSTNSCDSETSKTYCTVIESHDKASALMQVDSNDHSEMKFNLSEFRDDFFKIMLQLRSNSNLTDVQLKVDHQVIAAHKVVLAAASPYFKAMFTSGLQESDTSSVQLQGVCPIIVMKLVHFMYSGQLCITEQIVCPLLSAASMYQLHHVVDSCCKFLETQIESANVIGIANFAQQNGCLQLHAKATAFIEQNFSEVSEVEEFLELSGTQLSTLIKKDELNVPDEEAVYNSVVRWVEHRPRDRQCKMPFILKLIRCHYLPPRFLSDQMSNCKILKNIPACKEYLSNIFKELSLHKPLVGGVRCPRKTMCLFHLVGGYSQRSRHSDLYCYDVEKNTWAELGPMEVARSGLGAVFLRGCLYAVAGRSFNPDGVVNDTNVLTKYSHCNGAWSVCCSLQQCRNRMGVSVLDSLLYAVGGSDGSTILASGEKYDPETDSWRYVSPMLSARGGLSCTVLHRLLYAIGGCDGQSRLATVECYNPDRDVWAEVAPLSQARSGAGATVVCNRIYVVGGHDGQQQLNTVEMYDPDTDRWSFVSPMRVKRSALAVASSLTKIYVMGGFDGTDLLSSTEIYNVATDSWSDGPLMPWGRSGHAIAVPTCLLGPKEGTQPF